MAMKPGQYVEQRNVGDYPTRVRVVKDSASTMVLVGDGAPWAWAVVQRHVSGWSCLAVGTMPDAANESEAAEKIITEYGDGFTRLPQERFKLDRPDGEMIHILREGGNDTYCGSTAANPYSYTHRVGGYQQHHTACTDAFRAENYGRCPRMEG